MARILIPTPLRQFTAGEDCIEIPGATVGALLTELTEVRYPSLRANLYTPDGKLRSFVNIYLNDEDIRYLSKEHTAVAESDTISIVPSIAGGQ